MTGKWTLEERRSNKDGEEPISVANFEDFDALYARVLEIKQSNDRRPNHLLAWVPADATVTKKEKLERLAVVVATHQ